MSYRVVEASASVRPASVRSRSNSTVMSSRCGCARSDSVTPMCASTSRSLITILSTHNLWLSKKPLKFPEILTDQIRLHRPQFFHRIVACQHGTGVDAAGFARFDVMFHVADKHRLVTVEMVLLQDMMNLYDLVLN